MTQNINLIVCVQWMQLPQEFKKAQKTKFESQKKY